MKKYQFVRAGLTQHTMPLITEVEMLKQKSVLNPFIIKLVINLKEFLKAYLLSIIFTFYSQLPCRQWAELAP